MGFVSGLFSGGSGTNFQAQGAPIQAPVTDQQANQVYGQAQQGLNQQQAFVNALNAQNGIQNQSDVFAQQQALANQLQQGALGQGPNPALAQLNQATGNNIQNQAALMAGQRGSGSNAGLIARQAGMQGGNLQQQAVGQGATMQAQQQLAQQQALGQQQAQMAALSGNQVNQLAGANQGYNQAAQGLQSNVLGAIGNQNNARVGMQSNQNSTNAGIAQQNAQSQAGMFGQALGGAATGLGLFKAHGGMIPGYAQGGGVPQIPIQQSSGPQSFIGKMGNGSAFSQGLASGMGMFNKPNPSEASPMPAAMPTSNDWSQYMQNSSSMPSSRDTQLQMMAPNQHLGAPLETTPQFNAEDVGNSQLPMGNNPYAAMPGKVLASDGGKVPGQAMVEGDSFKNDVVDAKLSPGEIVIPRHITMHENAPEMAMAFVKEQLAKHKMFAEGGTVPDNQDWADKWSKMAKGFKKPAFADGGFAAPSEGMTAFQRDVGLTPEKQAAMKAFYASHGKLTAQEAMDQTKPQITSDEIGNIPQSSQLAMNDTAPLSVGTAPSVPKPELAPSVQDPYGYNDYLNSMKGALGSQMAGTRAEAAAQGALGKEQAQVESQNLQKLQQDQNTYQQNYNDLEVERKKFQSDLENGHIDPRRLIGNMSTGEKVMNVIGLILGGIGGGAAHMENPALKFLNSQIDHDIESQKADLGKRENLLSMNMKQFGNLNQAADMTKVMQMTAVESQLKKALAEAQDPLSKARAQQAIGQLQQQMAPIMQQITMKRSFTSGMANSDANPQQKLAGLIRSGVIPEAHQQSALKEYKEAANDDAFRQRALKAYDDIAKINTLKNRGLSPIQSKKQIEAIKGSIIPMLSKDTSGKYTESDAKALENIFNTFGGDEKTMAKQRQQVNGLFMDKANYPTLDTYGVNPFGKGRFSPSGESKLKLGPPKI